jgi:phosphatidylinositol alpha-1,6-mannosyltransferase
MSKVLLVSKLFPPSVGGVQSLMEGIVENSEHDIEVLTTTREENIEPGDYTTHRVDFEGFRGVFNVLKFLLRNSRDYDVIYFSRPTSTSKELVTKILGNKIISHVHGTEITEKYLRLSSDRKLHRSRSVWRKLMCPIGLRSTSKFIAVSEWTKNLLTENSVNEDDVKVIHPGINFDDFNPTEGRKEHRGEQLKILTVSRLHPVKNHKTVIDAVESMDDIEYTIIGDGQKKDELVNYVQNKGIEDKVEFRGEITENLPEHYKEHDVFIMPSKFEAFGIVFLEANSLSLPVIGSNAGGIPSAIKDGETGFVIEPQPRNIEKKLNELRDAEKRNEMAGNALKWAKDHDWSKIITKIDREIEKTAQK